MVISDKTNQLKKIKEEILNLKNSPLYNYRTKNKYFPVIGEGSHDAKIMFIGEAPGENEAKSGRPFCGAAGRILDEMLELSGLDRKEVYITNIVKDRPPANHDPSPEEIEIYSPFLDRQINIIQPQIIATLGRFSMTYIMEKFGLKDKITPISKMRGNIFFVQPGYGSVKIMPLYHPAVVLYNSNSRKDLEKDFKLLKSQIG